MQMYKNPLNLDVASALLFVRIPRSDVVDAINAHLNAVKVDEAQFDDAGAPFDAAAAVETLSEEIRLSREYCLHPCETADDVQAKIRYLLYGTVGERMSLIENLMSVQYGFGEVSEGLTLFLKSLLVPDFPREHTHAREEQTNG